MTNDLELNRHQDREVKSFSIHPRYSGRRRLYKDIAVIHLKTPFELSLNVHPISLPESEDTYDVDDCVVLGWGNQGAKIMKQVHLSLVENGKCQNLIRATPEKSDRFRLDDSFVCAGGEKGKDVCEGDGGGPLVCKRKANNRYVLIIPDETLKITSERRLQFCSIENHQSLRLCSRLALFIMS